MITEEVVVYVDDLLQATANCICRICHEGEHESCRSLEAPCACSGTVKFAHRDCIQRWCYEKGNTTCEICLQKFETGYIAPPTKSQIINAVVTIRGSLAVPRREPNPELAQERAAINNYPECSSSFAHSATLCRLIALMLTVLLLVKLLFVKSTEEAEGYPFSPVALLLMRSSGIFIPMCIIISIIMTIQIRIINHRLDQLDEDISSSEEDDDEEDEDDETESFTESQH